MDKSDKILWIGPVASKSMIKTLASKGFDRVAAYASQDNFIKGIEDVSEATVDILSALRLPEYPKYADLNVREIRWSHAEGAEDINVGFLNLKYISHISRKRSLKCAARQWALLNEDKKVKIIIYSMHSPFMEAAREVKKIIANTQIFLIVPDLPIYMDIAAKGVKRFLKKVDWLVIKRLMLDIDGYILYTKQMADYLNLPENKYIVVEGIIDYSLKNTINKIENKYDKKVCMYAGTLKRIYKIDVFTKAFINADVLDSELHIYGSGDFKQELEEICKSHPNIKYFGFQSNDFIVSEEVKATLLVNPRPTNDEYTKYSCPSKNLEYMASGTPLLTTKLAGIPEEYFNYTYTIEDETFEGLTNIIRKILSKSKEELHQKGKEAKKFVLSEKNNISQAKRMLGFMELI